MFNFSFNLIDAAHAESGGLTIGGFDLVGLLPFVVIFVAFYFLLIRPQQKKAQQQRDMLNTIQKGTRVITAGGIIGTISSIDNNQEVVLEIEGGGQIRILKSAISDKFPSGSAVIKDDNVKPFKRNAETKNTKPRKKPSQTKSKTEK